MVRVCSYIAQYPVRWTTQSALHLTPGRPDHSGTNSTSLGSIQPCRNYCKETFHRHFHRCLYPGTHLQLSELGHCGENENARASKQ